jgi:hypothetical protein
MCDVDLELELIQTHVAQKPLLWVENGCALKGVHAMRKRPGRGEVVL